METLYINTPEIGPRLFIQHGFATNISAKKIGSDCWINQQVTIGYTFAPEPPIIGNGVRISAGAKVLGQIEIGDNAIIAANAAVVKDVGENEVVGGVPAKTIGENDLMSKMLSTVFFFTCIILILLYATLLSLTCMGIDSIRKKIYDCVKMYLDVLRAQSVKHC